MFRFTIRDVLLVTVIVGLAVGWAVDHWRLAGAREKQAYQIYILKSDVQIRDDVLDVLDPNWRESLRRY